MTTSVPPSPNFSLPNVVHPIIEEPSMAEEIAIYGIRSAVRLPVNFSIIYGSLYTLEKSVQLTSAVVGGIYSTSRSVLGSAYCAVAECSSNPAGTAAEPQALAPQKRMTKGDVSMLVSMSLIIRPIASQCFQQLFGCKEDTPLRNAAALVSTSLTTTVLSSYATNFLGFETDTRSLVELNLLSLALTPALTYVSNKLKQMVEEDEQLLAEINALSTLENANSMEAVNSLNVDVPDHSSLHPSRVTYLSDTTPAKVEEINQDVLQAKKCNN